MTDTVYPKPTRTYVRRGRCVFCGSKKIISLYGYEWCDKPCSMGASGRDIYEQENHLGKYAPEEESEKPEME